MDTDKPTAITRDWPATENRPNLRHLLDGGEISAVDGSDEDLHVLGYGIDHHDAELLEALRSFRADRETRAQRMALALRELGFEFDDQLLAARLFKFIACLGFGLDTAAIAFLRG